MDDARDGTEGLADARLLAHLRPGDHVWVEEACGEPTTLVDALARVAHRVPGLTVHVGWALRRSPLLDAPVQLRAVMGLGAHGGSAGDYVPVRYSTLPKLMREGRLRVDVVLLQAATPDAAGGCALSVQAGWLPAALEVARCAIVELNARLPAVPGFPSVQLDRMDAAVDADHPLASYTSRPERAPAGIGEIAADLIPDGSVLEFGPGACIAAAVGALARRRTRLQVRSGLLTDDVVALAEAGCLSPEVPAEATMLCGTERLLDWATHEGRVRGLPLEESHDLARLSNQEGFVSLNSAQAVDLTGAVDTEDIEAGVTGGLGGHSDFCLSASSAPKGRSIIVLGAERRGASAIRPAVSATTARSDVDFVVTEHGVADLRGRSLVERAAALIAIAAPEHRPDLLDAAKRFEMAGVG